MMRMRGQTRDHGPCPGATLGTDKTGHPGGNISIGRIRDRPHCQKRNITLGGYLGNGVALHIHGGGPGSLMKSPLFRG